jgi:hypothetical protein
LKPEGQVRRTSRRWSKTEAVAGRLEPLCRSAHKVILDYMWPGPSCALGAGLLRGRFVFYGSIPFFPRGRSAICFHNPRGMILVHERPGIGTLASSRCAILPCDFEYSFDRRPIYPEQDQSLAQDPHIQMPCKSSSFLWGSENAKLAPIRANHSRGQHIRYQSTPFISLRRKTAEIGQR